MRKLASIQRITVIESIPGADAIERADVLGWSVVVKKDDFKVGDLAVYFEIDSWLDESISAYKSFEERFINWTDPEGNVRRGMRLRTIKLRKQLSQGLLLRTENFDELYEKDRSGSPAVLKYNEGDDVTEVLRVEKWEPYEEVKGNRGGNGQINKSVLPKSFPSFIRKTDQERVQNYINELPKHAEETFEASIKLDGSSMTVWDVNKDSPHYAEIAEDIERRALRKKTWLQRFVYKLKKRFGRGTPLPEFLNGVCSRNMSLDVNGDSHFAQTVERDLILSKLRVANRNVALQGELIAPSIQNNHENVKDFEYYVFDIFDIDKQQYLLPAEVRALTSALNMKTVPILAEAISLQQFEHEAAPANDPSFNRQTVDNILAFAEGPGMNPGVKREGVVFKSNQGPFSFKAISNSYLLKKESK